MDLRLAGRVARIKPSPSIAAKKRVTELRAEGRDIVDLTIGEPDLDTPSHVVDAAYDAMRRGDTHYTATPGTPALRAAVCGKLRRENGLRYGTDQVVVGCGAKQLIIEAFAATVDEGDEVVIPAPYWVSYPDMVALNGGTPVVVPCGVEVGFKLTPDALEGAMTPRTRWLVLNSPNNPTGAVYSRTEMKALTDVLARHPHVWVMTDDIYEHLVFDGAQAVNPIQVAPELAKRALIINGVSKAYAMTGWRLGYAAGPRKLVDVMATLIGQSTTCASSVSQAAATAALSGDQSSVAEATAVYADRRARMLDGLAGIDGLHVDPPAGAFYVYPSVAGLIGRVTPSGKRLGTDLDVAMYLLEEVNVAVLDGTAYGLSPHLRLSFAASAAAVDEGCARIRKACAALR